MQGEEFLKHLKIEYALLQKDDLMKSDLCFQSRRTDLHGFRRGVVVEDITEWQMHGFISGGDSWRLRDDITSAKGIRISASWEGPKMPALSMTRIARLRLSSTRSQQARAPRGRELAGSRKAI